MIVERVNRVLVIGYGNPGRRDDGLGPALAATVERWALPGVTVEVDYQLAVEHAATAAAHAVVIFADASVSGAGPFHFRRIAAKGELGFSSHALEPAAVLALARDLFGARTRGYVLGIRGYEFNEFGERLSAGARANLAGAASFLYQAIAEDRLEEAGAEAGDSSDLKDTDSIGDMRCKLASP
jgi:hydrogenase maturation protease